VTARASGLGAPRAVTLAVKVRPRAGRAEIRGRRPDGSLDVALRAVPEGGAANAELVALVARALGVRPEAIAIVRGATARSKLLRITGVDSGAVARLGSRSTAPAGSEETRGHDEP